MIGFDYWQDALDNLEAKKKETVVRLLEKYHGRIDEDEISVGDSVLLAGAKEKIDEDEALEQVFGAMKDLYYNYKDMKNDNTAKADDYFHCKANFEAAKRGEYGEKTAQILGNLKEVVDYFKNRMLRNLSPLEAYEDYLHDRDINLQGRQQAKSGLYKFSKDGCKYHRVRGINEKY